MSEEILTEITFTNKTNSDSSPISENSTLSAGEIGVRTTAGDEALAIANSEGKTATFKNTSTLKEGLDKIADYLEDAYDIRQQLDLKANISDVYSKTEADEIFETKEEHAADYADILRRIEETAQLYAVYGMARVNGETSPDGTKFFGREESLESISSIFHMGLVNGDGKLYKRCADGRIDLATDGTELLIDGSDGDVMVYIDRTIYVCKFTDMIDGLEMNVFALGLAPFTIEGHAAKKIQPFAFSPQFTVNCQLTSTNNVKGVTDVRACAHSIYNKNVAGTYSTPNNAFTTGNEFKPNGNGFFNQYISSMTSIWQAQCKNPESTSNRPFMGGYYEYTEIWLMLMFLEKKSLYHQALNDFGVGCTMSDVVNANTFWGLNTTNPYICNNSGVLISSPSMTSPRYLGLMSGSSLNGHYPLVALVGTSYYGFTEMLETQRLLSDVVKYGLSTKIVVDNADIASANWFTYNRETLICIGETLTVDDMEVGKKYYQISTPPKCKGLKDGVMTAVVNTYIKFMFNDGIKCGSDDCTSGYAIYKFSRSVYRGMSISMEGMFTQMQGCHYVRENVDNQVSSYFITANDVDDIPPQTTASVQYFGDANTTLAMEQGLTKKVTVHTPIPETTVNSHQGWAGKANYNASLFCLTDDDITLGRPNLSGSMRTKECSYLWEHASYANGDQGTLNGNGTPKSGRKCVNAVVVGCGAYSGSASARTVHGIYAVSYGNAAYAGRFSLPHLIL